MTTVRLVMLVEPADSAHPVLILGSARNLAPWAATSMIKCFAHWVTVALPVSVTTQQSSGGGGVFIVRLGKVIERGLHVNDEETPEPTLFPFGQ